MRKQALWLLVLAFTLLVASIASGAAALRHKLDVEDLARVRNADSGAAELLEKGGQSLQAGDLNAALSQLQAAAQRAPHSALAARRYCQALTAVGRRQAALDACRRALSNEGSALDLRAMVGALMSGTNLPTTDDLAQALMLANTARERMPREPYGSAAYCDIALKLGDKKMLGNYLEELRRVAPDHPETRQILARVPHSGSFWRFWLGVTAILSVCTATAAHALRRARKASVKAASLSVASLLVCFSSLQTTVAHADEASATLPAPVARDGLSEWPVNDNDPEASVPTAKQRDGNPLQFGYHLMDLAERGEAASARGDHRSAVRYYRALAKAVPDRSVSFAKACRAYQALGEWDNAVDACRAALARSGAMLDDYVRLAELLFAKQGELTPQERDDLSAMIAHLRSEEAGKLAADRIQCQLGVRISDTKLLEECTAGLAQKAPNDAQTISFQWALALKRRDFDQAERLIVRAKQARMKPEGIQQMEHATRDARPVWKRTGLFVTTLLLVLMGVAAIAVALQSRRATLHSA